MSDLFISLKWDLQSKEFTSNSYSPDHIIKINDNISFPASSALEYGGNKNNLNPEQGLVAAISSCHMMTFLALASKMKWPVIGYTDKAYAYLGKNIKGLMYVNKIELNPKIVFKDGFEVSHAEMLNMQDRAHRYCFIANSLSDDVEIKINT